MVTGLLGTEYRLLKEAFADNPTAMSYLNRGMTDKCAFDIYA